MRREDLTEAAQGIYEEELTSRGLARPASATEDEEEDPEAAAAAGGGLVSIAKYDSLEEGRFARNLLRNEGIPAWFAGELALKKGDRDPLAALELLTQAAFLEPAQLLLSSEISGEELGGLPCWVRYASTQPASFRPSARGPDGDGPTRRPRV